MTSLWSSREQKLLLEYCLTTSRSYDVIDGLIQNSSGCFSMDYRTRGFKPEQSVVHTGEWPFVGSHFIDYCKFIDCKFIDYQFIDRKFINCKFIDNHFTDRQTRTFRRISKTLTGATKLFYFQTCRQIVVDIYYCSRINTSPAFYDSCPYSLIWYLPFSLIWYLPYSLIWYLPFSLIWYLPYSLIWYLPVWVCMILAPIAVCNTLRV